MREIPDALVLCGGAGLRLRDVTGNGPKALAKIGQRPFLELLLKQLRRSGYRRAILAVGYQQEMIRAHFGDHIFGLELIYSPEESPLGTGGALRNAADLVTSDLVLVMNGDSYMDVNLRAFLAWHLESQVVASLVVAPPDGRGDCGNVRLAPDGTVAQFDEKQGSFTAGYLNAGIYLISTPMLYTIPDGPPVSLEKEVVPGWLAEGRSIGSFICSGTCVDIGTPERYRRAQENLAEVEIDTEARRTGNQL